VDPATGIRLEPLCDAHREGLRAAAGDPDLWTWWPRDVPGDGWDATMDWLLAEQAAGRWLAHTVFDLGGTGTGREAGPEAGAQGRIVGQTCYLGLRPEHRCVEIGGTWYRKGAQGRHVNPACKLALLTHAFASGAERVELKTDALNARSRAAILKLGARFEGIFRRHLLMPGGRWRDTAWYSILADEWPQVRAELEARLSEGLVVHGA
jgi:RimJ/RimL family protein N-acetyltransferase